MGRRSCSTISVSNPVFGFCVEQMYGSWRDRQFDRIAGRGAIVPRHRCNETCSCAQIDVDVDVGPGLLDQFDGAGFLAIPGRQKVRGPQAADHLLSRLGFQPGIKRQIDMRADEMRASVQGRDLALYEIHRRRSR